MASSNFIDYVKINVRSGAGGAGALHFRREKHVEKGGPDGGDGGRGGHVILKGTTQVWTLLHLKYTKHIRAFDGKGGEGGRRKGADGKDIYLEVPLGTIARDVETGEQLVEITEDGQEVILMKGGRGGLGNDHFKSATNQTPQHAQTGDPAIESWIILELKVLADVGLVGFPNAGKSTLLSVVSAARPEIADYPFTTLVPNLGVVDYRNYKSFVMADIPGIIEGASQGKGLGLRFLRHIERNSILLFMVPGDSEDIEAEYNTLVNELQLYNPSLLDKERLLAISKVDMLLEEEREELVKKLPQGISTTFISSLTGEGIDQLKDRIWELLNDSTAAK
ncbi:GTPase ObgE [Dyadobacter sp. CY356]|uniref:GTPase ObgE n=1 Tax=Dyadobacter sp. CY356 TaxID=2906442 RepID=UPI001F2563CB|nr:GTPase ObgE [Dyadobacter sp. CY356]MCF0056569.1 GTPase ObgE [Dyadobacter sp. CY356]